MDIILLACLWFIMLWIQILTLTRYITVKAESIKGIPCMGCFIRSKKDEEAMTLEEYKEMT